MNDWFQKSIRNKLAALVILAVVPAALFASLLSEWRESTRRIESKQNEVAGIAAALAATVSEPLSTGDRRQAANALKGIGAIPDITHVSVTDASGVRVFQFGPGIVIHSNGWSGSFLNPATYPVATPVVHAGREIGTLTVVADLSNAGATLSRSLNTALLGGLLSALAGIFASHRMQRAIARPITELTRTMREIATTRDFTRSIEPSTRDETGALVDSFNRMLAEIRTRDAELAQYHEDLEGQVRERTRDLAAATAEAERANAAKSEFLATMSHEIRTPMNGMLVMAELLAQGNLEPRARHQCDVILRSGQTLLAIINDILDLSKIEAGHLTLEHISLDPAALIDDVLGLFAERANTKGLQLASHVASDVPGSIVGDPVRLSQVLSNLIGNALKFTERGGVLVRLERVHGGNGELFRFSVADSGIGIAPERLAAIFEPFTQAEQSTTRRYGGTGIGLTICRRLVEAMGGGLRVESHLGSGSLFWFDISCDVAPSPALTPQRRSGTSLLLVAEGPVRTALELASADVGVAATAFDPAQLPESPPAAARFVVVPPDAPPAVFAYARKTGAPIFALARFGDAGAAGLLRDGLVRDLLELPLSGQSARGAFIGALEGGVLSRQAEAHPSPHSGADHAIAQPFTKHRILAADDSAINREVLKETLSRLGASIDFVEDGTSAVAAVQARHYDLVFMDGSMPVMDGFAAARAIRAWESAHQKSPVPIVGLSAHVFGDADATWRHAGMSDFITKPFTLAVIRKCLERWLSSAPPCTSSPEQAADTATAPASSTPPTVLIDPEVLGEIAAMQAPGDDLVGRVVHLYIEHAPRALDIITERFSRPEENAAMASAAHALKSLCRNIGAIHLGKLCGDIEHDARGGLAPPPSALRDLEMALHDTIAELRRLHPPSADHARRTA
ncbi:MAG: response regulator [Hyphomicrobiaceae bacterium]|nr:response regulator [Hyphomicrobiaceae bacterium]